MADIVILDLDQAHTYDLSVYEKLNIVIKDNVYAYDIAKDEIIYFNSASMHVDTVYAVGHDLCDYVVMNKTLYKLPQSMSVARIKAMTNTHFATLEII